MNSQFETLVSLVRRANRKQPVMRSAFGLLGLGLMTISGCSGLEHCRRNCSVVKPLQLTRPACLDRPCTCEPVYPRQSPIESSGIQGAPQDNVTTEPNFVPAQAPEGYGESEVGSTRRQPVVPTPIVDSDGERPEFLSRDNASSQTVRGPVVSPDNNLQGDGNRSRSDRQNSRRDNSPQATQAWQSERESGAIQHEAPNAFDEDESQQAIALQISRDPGGRRAGSITRPNLPIEEPSLAPQPDLFLSQQSSSRNIAEPRNPSELPTRQESMPIDQPYGLESRQAREGFDQAVVVSDPRVPANELPPSILDPSILQETSRTPSNLSPAEVSEAPIGTIDVQDPVSESILTQLELLSIAQQHDPQLIVYRQALNAIESQLTEQASAFPEELSALLREVLDYDEQNYLSLQTHFSNLRQFDHEAQRTSLLGLLKREEMRLLRAKQRQRIRYLWSQLYLQGKRFESSMYLADVIEGILDDSKMATTLTPAGRSLARNEIAVLRQHAQAATQQIDELHRRFEQVVGEEIHTRIAIPTSIAVHEPNWIHADMERELRRSHPLIGRLRIINESRTLGIDVLSADEQLEWNWTLSTNLESTEKRWQDMQSLNSADSTIQLPLIQVTNRIRKSDNPIELIATTRTNLVDQLLATADKTQINIEAIGKMEREILPNSNASVNEAMSEFKQGGLDLMSLVAILKKLHHLEYAYHQEVAEFACNVADAELLTGKVIVKQ